MAEGGGAGDGGPFKAGVEAAAGAARRGRPGREVLEAGVRALRGARGAGPPGAAGGAGAAELGPEERLGVEYGFRTALAGAIGASLAAGEPLMRWQGPAEGGEEGAGLTVRGLLDQCLELCSAKEAEPGLIFTLLEDLMEASTVGDSEEVFGYLEEKTPALAKPALFDRGKLILLRTCNQLLKRLSKTQNTVLCGRVLMLLSHMYPLGERSGVNLLGSFNTSNGTALDEAAAGAEAVTDREGERVNTKLYRDVWGLQEYFCKPSLVLAGGGAGWKAVADKVDRVLKEFADHPLGKGADTPGPNVDDTDSAKYLTNCRLLKLQLQDVLFRRQLLLQTLILLEFCRGPRRDDKEKLRPKQLEELERLHKRTVGVLQATKKDGPAFAETVAQILEREKLWIAWKKESCPPLEKAYAEEEVKVPKNMVKKKRKAPARSSFMQHAVKLGHPDLDQLWNICEDNTSCLNYEDQGMVPSVRDYLNPVIDQADPEDMIEEAYKVKNDKVYSWKALRLVARSNIATFGRNVEDLEDVIPILFPAEGAKIEEAKKKLKVAGANGAAPVDMDLDAQLQAADAADAEVVAAEATAEGEKDAAAEAKVEVKVEEGEGEEEEEGAVEAKVEEGPPEEGEA